MGKLQTILNSKYGLAVAITLGRTLPPGLGHFVAYSLGSALATQKRSSQVRNVRANQWVVHKKNLDSHELDRMVHEVFQHAGLCIYDMYHTYRNPPALNKKVELSPQALELVERSRYRKGAAVLVGPHLSNFDLAIQSLGQHGLTAMVLAYPQPPSGYKWQNKMRTQYGIEAVPFSTTSIQIATQRLKSGGMVLTGVERPITNAKYPVSFFGKTAILPVNHVQLAIHARVPVFVIACHMRPDGSYLIDVSPEIPMKSYGDHSTEIISNTEAVLECLAGYISTYPTQWLMFYPVWPDVLERMP